MLPLPDFATESEVAAEGFRSKEEDTCSRFQVRIYFYSVGVLYRRCYANAKDMLQGYQPFGLTEKFARSKHSTEFSSTIRSEYVRDEVVATKFYHCHCQFM